MVRDTVSTRNKLNQIEDKSSKAYFEQYKRYDSMKKELTMIEKDDYNGIAKLIGDSEECYWSSNVEKGKMREYVELLNEGELEVNAKDTAYTESTIQVNFEDGTKLF